MKNTYKIPEGCTSISIEQIGNKIVTEFETEFKKGDIILKKYIGSFNYILILDYIDKNGRIYYLAYIRQGDIRAKIKSDFGLGCEGDANTSLCLATQSEKQLLFDALAKSGKRWNAETLQIEDLKVEPKIGDCVKLSYSDGAKVYAKIKSSNNEIIFADFWYSTTKGINTYGAFISYDSIEILIHTQFQSEVNALGFEYNFKTDTFKVLKWEPKKNEAYWFVTCDIKPFDTKNTNSRDDKEMIKAGNCFKTKSECESAIEKIKNVLKSK